MMIVQMPVKLLEAGRADALQQKPIKRKGRLTPCIRNRPNGNLFPKRFSKMVRKSFSNEFSFGRNRAVPKDCPKTRPEKTGI